MSYALFERLYADAMRAHNPALAMREAAQHPELSDALRAAFAAADEDGVRMSALLVAKLRFERLVRGSVEVDAFFEASPARFTEIFRRYHEETPLTAFFPPEEAALFASWCAKNDVALGA